MPTLLNVIDFFGWIGATLILVAYYLITWRFITENSIKYHLLNLFGALGILVGVAIRGATFAAFLQSMWIFIAFGKIIEIMNNTKSVLRTSALQHHPEAIDELLQAGWSIKILTVEELQDPVLPHCPNQQPLYWYTPHSAHPFGCVCHQTKEVLELNC